MDNPPYKELTDEKTIRSSKENLLIKNNIDYIHYVNGEVKRGNEEIKKKDKVIRAVFSTQALVFKDNLQDNTSFDERDKRKASNRIYFKNKVLLDSGANISATSQEESLTHVERNIDITINGSTGNDLSNTIGISKVFGTASVVLKGLKFDILSFSETHRNHQITFIDSKCLFIVRRIRTNMFYIFSLEEGLYLANCTYDLSQESLTEVLKEYPDIRSKKMDFLGLVDSWNTRKNPKRLPRELQGEYTTDNVDNKHVELNALVTDMEYARKMMGLSSKVNESLLKQVENLRVTHLALGHVGRAGMMAHVEAHNKAVRKNKENHRSMRSKRAEISKEAVAEYFRWFGTCTTCAMSKMTADENHWRSTYEPKDVGDVIHVDWTFYTRNLNKCFFVSIDEMSDYAYIVHSENKSAKNASFALDIIKSHFHQHKHRINNVYCDNDPSFSDKSFGVHQVFVKNETSGAHNSKIERFNRTWENIILALKVDLGIPVPDSLFHKLMKFACDSYNMRQDEKGTSPYRRFHKKEYSFELLNWSFGDLVIATNNNAHTKNDLKGIPGMIVGRVMSSDSSYEFLDLHTKTISVKAKFVQIKNTADRDKYLGMVKKLDHELVLELNAGKHEKVRPKALTLDEFGEMNEARKVVTEDKDPSLLKSYSKNKTWIIEDLYFHYMRGDEKTFRVKWKGYQLIDDSCDLSESKLLASGYSIEDLAGYPSKQQYARIKKIDIKHIFVTHVSINDLYIDKETPMMADEHLDSIRRSTPKNLSTENMTLAEGMMQNKDMANAGVEDEIRTLIEFGTWRYVHWKHLSAEERKNVLSCFLFLKNKFGEKNAIEKIKARLVAGGHMQDRETLDPEMISSTTLRTASYQIILNLAALEDTELSIIDIRSAYLQANLPEDLIIHMVLRKEIADIVVRVDPSAKEFVDEKGQLYVRLVKALYGLVQSAKIWYDCLVESLGVIGYKPLANVLDRNIVTKMMDPDEKHELPWLSKIGIHVDDLGISSSVKETQRIKEHLTKRFGEVKFQSGLEMDWLGIHISRDRIKRTITLSQINYIERMLSKFENTLKFEKFENETTPATNDLFRDATDEHKTDTIQLEFLSILMSIAFLAYRTRPDILAVVSYLSTRVLHKDPKDMEALIRLIGYIQYTSDKVMTLSPTGKIIHCWTDASYGNHAGKKGHSGIVISMSHDETSNHATGFLYAMSSKQKLVAQSTAESELIAQAEGLKYLLWIKHVMEALNYSQDKPMVIFHQDNMAAIQMSNTGTGKFKNTKHIEHRLFLIQNHLESDHIEMKFCPTDRMIADLLTKTTFTGPKVAVLTACMLNEKQ